MKKQSRFVEGEGAAPSRWDRRQLLAVAVAGVAPVRRIPPLDRTRDFFLLGLDERRRRVRKMRVYFGTYTGAQSRGIYTAVFDLASGIFTAPELAAETANPSFLAIHPSGKYLYSVGEIATFQGRPGGAVNAFRIDPKNGGLTLINQQSSGGAGPCHVTVDRAGKNVLCANYGGGSVACLPVGKEGALGAASAFVQHAGSSVNRQRQEGPHAHSINLDPANRFAFAADLGLDKVLIYRFDARAGTLQPHDPAFAAVAPGSGPRHFAFRPDGKFAYVINEMLLTVTAFAYDAAAGTLTEIQTAPTTPDGVKPGYSTAEVVVHPSGDFLYGSNRGHHSIACFRIQKDGTLISLGHAPTQGRTPRNFAVEPTGNYLMAANQDSDSVVLFRIDQETGQLTPTGTPLSVPRPVCIRFLPL